MEVQESAGWGLEMGCFGWNAQSEFEGQGNEMDRKAGVGGWGLEYPPGRGEADPQPERSLSCSQATSGHYFSGSWSKQPGREHHTLAVSDCHCAPQAQLLNTQVFVFLPMLFFFICACACMLSRFSHVWLSAILWVVARQAPLSKGFSRQVYWSWLLCSPPGDLPNRGIEPESLMSPAALAGGFFTTSATWEVRFSLYIHKEIQFLPVFLKIIFSFLLFLYLIHILFFEKNFLPTSSHMSLVLPLPQFSHRPTLWYLLFLLFQPHQSSTGALIGRGREKWSRWNQNLLSSLNTGNDPPILLASTDLQEGSFYLFFNHLCSTDYQAYVYLAEY